MIKITKNEIAGYIYTCNYILRTYTWFIEYFVILCLQLDFFFTIISSFNRRKYLSLILTCLTITSLTIGNFLIIDTSRAIKSYYKDPLASKFKDQFGNDQTKDIKSWIKYNFLRVKKFEYIFRRTFAISQLMIILTTVFLFFQQKTKSKHYEM